MFQTVPLFIIRSFSLYTQQWCMSYSLRAGSGRNWFGSAAADRTGLVLLQQGELVWFCYSIQNWFGSAAADRTGLVLLQQTELVYFCCSIQNWFGSAAADRTGLVLLQQTEQV